MYFDYTYIQIYTYTRTDYIFLLCVKVCKKTNIPPNIYPHNTLHNNLGYIAQSYTLLYILIMRLKLKIGYLFAWYFFSAKIS